VPAGGRLLEAYLALEAGGDVAGRVGQFQPHPEVTLTRAALLGAALGTAVLPGVGTGARIGDSLGEKLKGLFGK